MKLKIKTTLPVILILISLLFLSFGCKKRSIPLKSAKPSKNIPDIIYQKRFALEKGKRGGSIIRADIQEIDNLNIVTTRSQSVYSVLKLVFESLLMVNPYDGSITGCIAKDYKISDNGLSVILHLNKDVFFSDGKRCTADDVIFSFDKIYLNPQVNSKKIDSLTIRNKTVKIARIDDYTVRFDLPVPYRPFLYTLTQLEILPKHLLEPAIEKGGIEWFNKKWGAKNGTISDIIGTGPYKILEYQRGKSIKLVRNPYYSQREGSFYLDGMPYIDEIIELLNIDNDTKVLKFEIGEIDFYDTNETDFENGNLDSLIKNSKDGNYSLYYSGQTMASNNFLVFNQNPEALDYNKELAKLFRNRMFRRAVAICIDREAISKNLYRGYASYSLSPIRDCSPYYKDELKANYNPQKAREILAEIGLEDTNKDGFLEFSSGESLSFTIYTNSDNPLRKAMGEKIVEDLKSIGVKAEITPIEYDLLITKLLDNFNWEAVIIGATGSIEPNDLAWIWESKGPLHIWYPYQEQPSTQWEKRIDKIFAMGRTTWNMEESKKLYSEFQDIAVKNLPIINIVTPYQIYGYRNRYKNIFASPVSYKNIGILPYIFQK